MRTAYDLVALAAQRTPDHSALVDDRTDRQLTFSQLVHEVDVVAAGLAERGVVAGDIVATALPNLFEHCLVLLALQRVGAIPALLNFRLGKEDLGALMLAAEVKGAVVLADQDLVAGLRARLPASAFLLSAQDVVEDSEALESCRGEPSALGSVPKPDPDDPSFLFYTSGTTGLPKAVVVPHRANEPRVTWLSTMMGLRSGTHLRSLGVSPLSHAIGFHGVFLATLAYNGTFFVMSAFDPARAVDLVEQHEINYLFSLPTIFGAMVSSPSYRPERVRSLELVYWGGAPMPGALLERLVGEWPARFGHVYGTTETMCAMVNCEPVGQPEVLWQAYSSRVRVVKKGAPETDAAIGEQGELLIDATGDCIFTGYLNRPRETADKLRGDWYHSGDAAVVSEDGSIRLHGRVDDMIRSGGEYVQPEEVEAVLCEHPMVSVCAVVGLEDDHWGQIVVACVVLEDSRADGSENDAASELDRVCRSSSLANFKRPRSYLFLNRLPMSAGNKLQRKSLRQTVARAVEGEQSESSTYVAISQ